MPATAASPGLLEGFVPGASEARPSEPQACTPVSQCSSARPAPAQRHLMSRVLRETAPAWMTAHGALGRVGTWTPDTWHLPANHPPQPEPSGRVLPGGGEGGPGGGERCLETPTCSRHRASVLCRQRLCDGQERDGSWAGRMGNRSVCLAEIQSKRQERKRRSTANPAYSGLLETEVRPPFSREGGSGWPPSHALPVNHPASPQSPGSIERRRQGMGVSAELSRAPWVRVAGHSGFPRLPPHRQCFKDPRVQSRGRL